MAEFQYTTEKSSRISALVEHLYANLPVIEPYRAEIVRDAYLETEDMPMIRRRSRTFMRICEKLPIIIRKDELIVGSNSLAPRGCQTFPEYSYTWLESEFDTLETREADPFYISEDTKKRLKQANAYFEGKTNSDLAASNMSKEAYEVFMNHGVFTVGNYFYNGVGHICVDYDRVLREGYSAIRREAEEARNNLGQGDSDYASRYHFLTAVIECCDAAVLYARRYAALATEQAKECADPVRRKELFAIAEACQHVPEQGAGNFHEACQSFWFVQMLLQTESSGHSISPGRFDQYMYPYYKKDRNDGKITNEQAQELIDCIWVKLNDLNKVRDAASAEGFAGYGLFQNLIVGGQNEDGRDATNPLSYMCLEASIHVRLPQPSLSIRVCNASPQELLMKAGYLTRLGDGLPAYYNDEIILPALMSRGLSLREARDYCIIGCVEPQKAAHTDGWHDAAFFNMCRPLELVFSNGMDKGKQIGPKTGNITSFRTFDDFYEAYKAQQSYMIALMVNADNAVDAAHAVRCPLPFESSMVNNCIKSGKSVQEGGAKYNFTGPQGFGIANVTDALLAIRQMVFEEKTHTLAQFKDAMAHNFGFGLSGKAAEQATVEIAEKLAVAGLTVDNKTIEAIYREVSNGVGLDKSEKQAYRNMHARIAEAPKYGNDIEDVDLFARDVAYTYTKEVEKYKNPRGGMFQAGLYPVSANVPLGAQTGATPDGRLAFTPIADGVGPASGRDNKGPTAAANSVAKLDHGNASNGTLFNQKFHPAALHGDAGLAKFVALIRGFFDQDGMHMQFNVVNRETLIDAQKHPENYKNLVVRVAGYSALFTTLSKALQDDIIHRTEHFQG